MNQPYPPSGGEPYGTGGGPGYPARGQQSYPPSWQPGGPPPFPIGGGQQYPAGSSPRPFTWRSPIPSEPPPSIQRAVVLMYVGAGLEVLGLIFNLITRQGSTAAGIPGTLIGIGLWIWMARANQAGKDWARITSTVFFGIDCLFLLLLQNDPMRTKPDDVPLPSSATTGLSRVTTSAHPSSHRN